MADKKKGQGIDRRDFIKLMGGAIGSAALGTISSRRVEAKVNPQKGPLGDRRLFKKRPNFLILMNDEERFPPVYENDEVKQWRRRNLVTQELLRHKGMEFIRHYTGATACVPARATFFTGQYPSLHGVTQTTGAAKGAYDADTFWLDPDTVPTIGDYFRAAGYRTHYKGKWHVSAADLLIPGTHESVLSYDPNTGRRDREKEQLYLKSNRLGKFGFSGWIGPEPHGKEARNSGSSAATGISGRDIGFASQVVELIRELERKSKPEPWLIVSSFVDPHDIAVYGFATAHGVAGFGFTVDSTVPDIPPPPTFDEDLLLNKKPICQKSYHDTYGSALQPFVEDNFYRRFYYQLQKNVDQQMLRVFKALRRSSFYNDTIVIFTSDHGELLGAHGRLVQKWYCAYEEAIHVPFIIHNPVLFQDSKSVEMLTSHVDVLPTMLGLAGIDVEVVQEILGRDHAEVQPLVGRDLSPLILGNGEPEGAGEPIYFMTDDDFTRGLDQKNWHGWAYNSVVQPNHVETVIATFETSEGEEIWKYSRYFDNPQFWTDPGCKDDVQHEIGNPDPDNPPKRVWGGIKPSVCTTTEKVTPVPEEFEMYNLSQDPLEIENLAYSLEPELVEMRKKLDQLLNEQRCQKRLSPSVGCVPGMPSPCGPGPVCPTNCQ